ncbi:CMGC/RCK protein kinase [Fonticula alba]|uniref:CMGC/RCK protein kinase n=1 Tax=Fonticula alba TaxID=691883 RepID=A0A058Z0L0_FONAL|nr:CMGC/RCK protein kinase [Fonticula alba]KCV67671.1 CMGC/RCK protein kinase [Fonticula alba]|eukprot:XP_009497855.1 CMGC/RCK protein kinase [Fonticula alba]
MERYRNLGEIGRGTYGVVFSAQDRNTNKTVAIKQVKQAFRSWDECLAQQEVQVLRAITPAPTSNDTATGCQNIVHLLRITYQRETLFFIFEHMDCSLLEYVRDYRRPGPDGAPVGSASEPLPRDLVRSISQQLFRGVAYLHSRGYYHRDIKPENILLNRRPDGRVVVKLADFGLARTIAESGPGKPVAGAGATTTGPGRPPGTAPRPLTDYIATRWYRSPELLLRAPNYGPAIDIWATGCVLYEVLTRVPLLAGRHELHQLQLIVEMFGCPLAGGATCSPNYWAEAGDLAAGAGVAFVSAEAAGRTGSHAAAPGPGTVANWPSGWTVVRRPGTMCRLRHEEATRGGGPVGGLAGEVAAAAAAIAAGQPARPDDGRTPDACLAFELQARFPRLALDRDLLRLVGDCLWLNPDHRITAARALHQLTSLVRETVPGAVAPAVAGPLAPAPGPVAAASAIASAPVPGKAPPAAVAVHHARVVAHKPGPLPHAAPAVMVPGGARHGRAAHGALQAAVDPYSPSPLRRLAADSLLGTPGPRDSPDGRSPRAPPGAGAAAAAAGDGPGPEHPLSPGPGPRIFPNVRRVLNFDSPAPAGPAGQVTGIPAGSPAERLFLLGSAPKRLRLCSAAAAAAAATTTATPTPTSTTATPGPTTASLRPGSSMALALAAARSPPGTALGPLAPGSAGASGSPPLSGSGIRRPFTPLPLEQPPRQAMLGSGSPLHAFLHHLPTEGGPSSGPSSRGASASSSAAGGGYSSTGGGPSGGGGGGGSSSPVLLSRPGSMRGGPLVMYPAEAGALAGGQNDENARPFSRVGLLSPPAGLSPGAGGPGEDALRRAVLLRAGAEAGRGSPGLPKAAVVAAGPNASAAAALRELPAGNRATFQAFSAAHLHLHLHHHHHHHHQAPGKYLPAAATSSSQSLQPSGSTEAGV